MNIKNKRDGPFYLVQNYKKVIEYFVNVLDAYISKINENVKIIIIKYNLSKFFLLKGLYDYVKKEILFIIIIKFY